MEFGDVLENIHLTDARRVKLKSTLVSLPVHDTCKHSEHRIFGSLFFVPTNFDTKSLGVDKKFKKLQFFIGDRMPCLKKLSCPYGVGKRFLVEQTLMAVDGFVCDLLKTSCFL